MGCWFFSCKWLFVFNTGKTLNVPSGDLHGAIGVYQCAHCKRLSVGRPQP